MTLFQIDKILKVKNPQVYRENLAIAKQAESDENSKFWVALENESANKVKKLYDHTVHKERPFSGGESPLHIAAYKGNLEIVKILVEKSADINARDEYFLSTPLLDACMKGHHDVVKYLLDKGAIVNVQDKILESPLHKAILYQNTNIVNLLLEYGANKALTNIDGLTPAEALRNFVRNSELKVHHVGYFKIDDSD